MEGRAVGLPGGDDEAIQHGGVVRPAASDDVIDVVALDVCSRLGDVVAVGVDIVLVNVAAENGEIGLPVALVALHLGPGKAAVEGHAVLQGEGGFPISSCAGVVNAHLDPDFIAANSLGEGSLQGAGIGPRGAVTATLRNRRGIEHAGVGAGGLRRGQGDRSGQG